MNTPVVTHYEGCWQDHLECAREKVVQLEIANASLRSRTLLAEAERNRMADRMRRWFGLLGRQINPNLAQMFREMQSEVQEKKL